MYSSPWLVAIFRICRSYVFKLIFTGWLKNLLLIITLWSFISTTGRLHFVFTFLSSLLSNYKIKSLFTLLKCGSIKKSKCGIGAWIVTFDWCFFTLVVYLKPNFNCCNSFAISGVDKVTTRTQSFISAIANFVAFVSLDNIHLLDQIKLISQLIKNISRAIWKLLRYFNTPTTTYTTASCFTCYFLFKFKRSTVISSTKISNSASIIYNWFISIVLP